MTSIIDRLTARLPRTGPLASPLLQRIALGVVLLAAISVPLVVQTPPLDLEEGRPAPRTVRAPRAVQFVDEAAAKALKDAGIEDAEDVVIVKQAGENIVVEGEIVTARDIEVIRRLGLLEQSGSVASFGAIIILCGLMLAIAAGYIRRYDTPVWDDLRSLVLLATLFGGMVWFTRAALWWRADVPIYALPVPLVAMLATLLLSAREGMVMAAMTSLAAVMLGFSSGDTVVSTFAWSIAGVVAVSYMTDRRRQLYIGAALVASGSALAFLATLASGIPLSEAFNAAGQGGIGGGLAVVLGYGLLPFFEHIFDITTDVRLLELANPANKLLRDLMVAAPGTYSHSVMTANLAETAAQAIGANALLARVGAYYHDVGKMRRPGFFVENQSEGVNPHSDITAQMSALIIHAHVKDGIELAREYKLPKEVVDVIRQHHGTSLVSYFYNKAAEEDMKVRETDFRYDGQLPQTREAAIVMLADACEAAVRAIRKRTVPRIESTVRTMVDGKLNDGQLDSSDLTLSDIESIVQVYSRMLAAVYHPRVEYPTAVPRRQGHEYYPDHEPSRS